MLTVAVRRYRSRKSDGFREDLSERYLKTSAERLEAMALSSLGSEQWSAGFNRRIQVVKRILLVISVAVVIEGLQPSQRRGTWSR